MQYSYLPSWLSFLVDQERAQSNAAELITAIRVELDSLPPDERPELYVYGESLGAYSRPAVPSRASRTCPRPRTAR
jgi:uncharacterized membrane protein